MIDPSVVEQHIDSTEPLERLLDGLPAFVRDTHVAANEHRLTTGLVDGLCDLLAALLVASGEHDDCPLLGEQGGCGATYTRVAASD
jgi:hypothetical protein